MDYTIRIGGEAGQGLQTIGGALAKSFSRAGFHVFSHQDYMSRIRGGHNFYQIRFSSKELTATKETVDVLIALDLNTIDVHRKSLSDNGIILYDADFVKKTFEGPEFLNIPFEKIAVEKGESKIMANSVAIGAVLGIFGLDLSVFKEIIKVTLKKKGDEIIQKNILVAEAGLDHAVKHCSKCKGFELTQPSRDKKLMLINGTSAIGLGAVMSGCKFYCAYPMTPSTGVFAYIAGKAKKYGIVVEQVEDEIAAINMALGASFGGVRAMTGSSGGGFALMAEGLSLAGMTETPIVIYESQRPGPATGLPTRTEQGDLLFVLHAGHGEFPRVVFAPGTPEQAFYLTNKAFDLTEKYQIPVFVQSDQYLADSEWTHEKFDMERLVYRDYRLRGQELEKLSDYKRHAYTETGVTPLAVSGVSKHLVVTDSDEHDEEGHIVEDGQTRIRMTEKRLLKKLPLIKQEIDQPLFYGTDKPEILLTGYGSTYGVMKEAVDIMLKDKGIAMLHFSEVYPLPLLEKFDYLKLLKGSKLTVCIEMNATSQFARLIQSEIGYVFDKHVNKYDGRPFTIEGLIGELNACIR